MVLQVQAELVELDHRMQFYDQLQHMLAAVEVVEIVDHLVKLVELVELAVVELELVAVQVLVELQEQ